MSESSSDPVMADMERSNAPAPAKAARKASWRTGTRFLLLCTALGAAAGVSMSVLHASDDMAFWVAYPGSLFIRGLKCLIVPMIFCSMVCGVAELSSLGQTGNIGSRTFGLYVLTTFMAAVVGISLAVVFQGTFSVNAEEDFDGGAELTLKCPTGKYMTVAEDGVGVACSADSGAESTFLAHDEVGFWAEAYPLAEKDVQDTIAGIGYSLIPDNIVAAAAVPDILSVIAFAIFFGAAIARVHVREGQRNVVLEFMLQLNEVISVMVRAAIGFAPFGIASLIAGALAETEDFAALLKDIGLVIVAVLLGLTVHVLVALPTLYRVLVGEMPFGFLRQCSESFTFAFGCSSSAATLPVTIHAVEATGTVPSAVAKFVLSLGATVNMNGSAVYYPISIVFLATVSGIGDQINVGTLLVIALASTLGAVGSSPIPSAGLVMMITIWDAVFPGVHIPPQIAYLQAIDWLLDRFITATNVAGDVVVTRIVAQLCTLPTQREYQKQKHMVRHVMTGDKRARKAVDLVLLADNETEEMLFD